MALRSLALAAAALTLVSLAAPDPASARDCRGFGAPRTARAAERRGCKPPQPPELERSKPTPERRGFLDLGGGTEIRISGGVRFEGEVRR